MWTKLLLVLVLLALAMPVSAQTTTTAPATTTTTLALTPPFPTLNQPSIGSGSVLTLANGQRCNATPCETGPFHVTGSEYPGPTMYFDCKGTCVAAVVCRLPGMTHDVTLAASGTLTDASAKVAVPAFCPSAYLQITTCTACNFWAWAVNAKPN